MTPGRPSQPVDPGLQQERTSLAWERTAVSMMVAGVLLARFGAQDAHPVFAAYGVAQTAMGAVVLVWAGLSYERLHQPLRAGDDVCNPTATRLVGLAAVVFTVVASLLGLTVSVTT